MSASLLRKSYFKFQWHVSGRIRRKRQRLTANCIRLDWAFFYSGLSGTGVQDLSGLKSSIFLNSSRVVGPRSFS